jgi:hypothetical protein
MLLSACNLPSSKDKENNPDAISTQAALTVEALQTQLAVQQTSTPVTFNTATLAPSQTSVPSATTAPTLPPPPATATPIPCDRVDFVSDVTIPDGTGFNANTSFTKTWRLKNNGSCTWTTSYKLIFISGDAMSGPATQALPSSVAPGQTVDISVNLKSPGTANDYQGNYKLQNASGVTFGTGAGGGGSFYVKIKVTGTATPAFAITDARVTVGSQPSGCPKAIPFAGSITSTAAGHVTYYWELSDGTKSATQSVDFTNSGTQVVAFVQTIAAAGNYTMKIYVDNPNHQYFGETSFTVTCP